MKEDACDIDINQIKIKTPTKRKTQGIRVRLNQ